MGICLSICHDRDYNRPCLAWDIGRRVADKIIAELIGKGDLPTTRHGSGEDAWFRPVHWTVWREAVNWPIWADDRFAEMLDILDREHDCWVHFSY